MHWNLIQALGWLYLRDETFLNEAADDAHKDRWVNRRFEMPDGTTRTVEQPDTPHNVFSILVDAEFSGNRHFPSIEEAQAALIQALVAGKVKAFGLENDHGNLEGIPATFWIEARFYFEPDMAASKDFIRAGASRWTKLRFPANEILRLWPPPVSTDKESTEIALSEQLSFKQIAARWLAEQSDTGLMPDDLSADLVAVAEAGHFTSKPVTGKPVTPFFNADLMREIHTFSPDNQPATPDEIQKFTSVDGASKIHTRRLTAARDLTVFLSSFINWIEGSDGTRWRGVRGLKAPAFILKSLSTTNESPQTATVLGERECFEWLLDLMRTSDQRKPKIHYKTEALSLFRVSGLGFNRAWANAREASKNRSWGKPGRKSSRVNRFTN